MKLSFLKYFLSIFFINFCFSLQAQDIQKAMVVDDLVSWKRITNKLISDNGKWVACLMEPWKGDGTASIYNSKGKMVAAFTCIDKLEFTSSSDYLLMVRKAPSDTLESIKLKNTNPELLPKDQLIIHQLSYNKHRIVDSLKSYKLSGTADWIASQHGGKTDSSLYIYSLRDSDIVVVPVVTDYRFAKDRNILYYISRGDSDQVEAGLYTYDPEERKSHLIYAGEGIFKQIAFDEKGEKLAFLYSQEKDTKSKNYSLFVFSKETGIRLIATGDHPSIPSEWSISEFGEISFSENSERLFFGVAPQPRHKDSTVLAENRPDVDIWKWDEQTQYTVQKYNREKDLKKSYTLVYNFKSNDIIRLTDPETPHLLTADRGNSKWGIVSTTKPYDLERMWVGRARYDIYTINLDNGDRFLVKKGLLADVMFSPKGKYAYWYNLEDSSWYTYSPADKKEYRITDASSFTAWNEENDVPDYPYPYGIAGWGPDDDYVFIYDRYDIWSFDPASVRNCKNLTVNGKNMKIRYRYIPLDKEKRFIEPGKLQMIIGFNERTKGYGYYRWPSGENDVPFPLLTGDFMLQHPLKAKNANMFIYSTERFDRYPDLLMTDSCFKKSVKLTNGFEQQKHYIWGKAELVSWLSLDGRLLEGIVYKPADFDPQKKYPLIVNFYERNSETLHSYRMPEPHRSTIDYHLYNSNGYIIFNPDIVYDTGYPGESCFNCVMPGISSLIEKGYINQDAIGAQGHSWGGYQVAYLATRTNLFAAIESGAPVVNMFSAYGGIRWGSGLNRSFQYEHTQSRIGATIWEKPLRYLENSPLFTMDKVETPILIMHNDHDGHVPWYQGIEYFIALKRLQKPVWMLNYPGELHWPQRLANKIDFQKRMYQFFDHYLNKQPMPKWMDEGIPAVDKDFELAY